MDSGKAAYLVVENLRSLIKNKLHENQKMVSEEEIDAAFYLKYHETPEYMYHRIKNNFFSAND